MLCRRTLLGPAFLITVLLSCSLLPCQPVAATAPASELQLLAPGPQDLLIGTVELRLAVPDHQPPIERVDLYVHGQGMGGQLIGSALPPSWSLTWEAPRQALGATVVAVAYAGGEAVARTRLSTPSVSFGDEINVVMVQLYPVVVDRRGRYLADLTRDDFVVLDQGREVAIERFSTEATSLSIMLLLDVSSSMADRLGLVQEASAAFVDRLEPADQVGLAAFSIGVQPVVPLTQDHDQVMQGMRGLRAGGSTALYDALLAVLDTVKTVPGRRAVFLFSDGLDERSLSDLDRVINAARRSEAIIYCVGTGEDDEARAARKDLRILAEETGGEAHFIRRMRELPQVFDAVLRHLRSQYALGYTPPPGPAGLRPVEVRVKGKGTVHCRRSYYHHGAGEEQ